MPTYTRNELNDMQEYLKEKLKLLSINHSYPNEERVLSMLLCILMEVKVE